MARVTVVVLSYNGRNLLKVLLPSLEAQTYRDYKALLVDNGSDDGTGAWLADSWPWVDVLSIPSNIGVAAGINRGLAAASGELVLLLNNDIELDESCLEQLVDAMDAHPRSAVAGAKLLDYSRRELLDGTGDVYNWAGIAHRRGQGEVDRGQYDDKLEVFGACAAAALYRRSALDTVGLFDEWLYMYWEDVDWAFRAQLAGYDSRYVPSARAYHIGSASLGPRVNAVTLRHNWRNQLWVVAKNYPGSALVLHAPDLLLGQLSTLVVALRHRLLRTWLRAWHEALRDLPRVLSDRRAIQARRVRGRGQLEPVMESVWKRAQWWLFGDGRTQSIAMAPRAPAQGSEH